MSRKCAYCGKAFTCGCQKTTGANGATVCKTCKSAHDQKNGTTIHRTSQDMLTKRVNQAKKNLRR